ncbi:type II RES/Xre toxin-antitoxin system antitoxin [Peristeroidobacter soli]|jgi:putative toxin-antitoxin system antitoxin component (TIGR02293 family)|uniref:type II RES/Xre toxin-antitoxin system antitoxin n=1 Tax=Peristeroidobacter soli TaxID=2497877 RepID=UPI001300419D|nr:antitoxin Xre/MbcA/ParS toxin-binding domain-containing protein [Peristeroidobacter soli]
MTESVPRVAEVLGGVSVLGEQPKNTDAWMTMIETGLPAAAAEALKEVVGLDDPSLAVALGVSIRTLARTRAVRGRLDSVVSDRLYRLARLVAIARVVLEHDDQAVYWLTHPQPGLGDRRPIDFARSEPGAREVENLLLRIEHGVYS